MRYFTEQRSFNVRFVGRDDVDFNAQRYTPEIAALCNAVMHSAIGIGESDKVTDRVQIYCACRMGEDLPIGFSVTYRLNFSEAVRKIINALLRKQRLYLVDRVLLSMGLSPRMTGFIQSKLWLNGADDFMVAAASSGHCHVAKRTDDGIDTLPINRDVAELLSSESLHKDIMKFLAPLRCGAIVGIEIQAREDEAPIMLTQEDARAFDCKSMAVNKIL